MSDQPRESILTDFQVMLPRFEVAQEKLLDWLFEAHLIAGAKKDHSDQTKEEIRLKRKEFQHFFVKSEQIRTRWVDLPDITNKDWQKHAIYNFSNEGEAGSFFEGGSILDRTELFASLAFGCFQYFYPTCNNPPQHLLHVTCTGYASPSAAQQLVAHHKWTDNPKITHAYHMGCYAALSSIRIAEGLLHSNSNSTKSDRVDLVHTELCSLHMNPVSHAPEELVIQSLFADGYIKYSVINRRSENPGFLLLEHAEQIIPDTSDKMTWITKPWGMGMTLSRKVPQIISGYILPFLRRILEKTGISIEEALKDAYFALHPGGPKIISAIQEHLKLQDWQVQASRDILLTRGNMSSATLPHIWKELLHQNLKPGTKVVSLAFGPGLSILGTVFESV